MATDYGTADFTGARALARCDAPTIPPRARGLTLLPRAAGFVDCLWPTAEELALPPSFSVHDDSAVCGAFLLDIDFFGASAAPSDEDFARLLLLGEDAAAGDAAAKPAGRPSQRSDSGAKPLTPARRRTGSPPGTPEKSDGKAPQARRAACHPGRPVAGRPVAPLHAYAPLPR
jgi:hypothetical protein